MESSESVTPSVEEARAFLGRVVGGYNAHKTEYIEVIGLLLAALVEARAERDAPAHAHYNVPSQPLTATEEVLVIVVGQYQEAEAEIARLRDALDVLDLRAGSAEERQALNFERAKRAESARDKYRAEVERLQASLEVARGQALNDANDAIDLKMTALENENARLRAEHEAAMDEVLKERDDVVERLDQLVYAVAPVNVIGEDSSANDPWANALVILKERARYIGVLTDAEDALEAIQIQAVGVGYEIAHAYFERLRALSTVSSDEATK